MLLLCTYTCFIALYREKWNWTSLLVASFRNFGNEYCQLVIDLHLHCFCQLDLKILINLQIPNLEYPLNLSHAMKIHHWYT